MTENHVDVAPVPHEFHFYVDAKRYETSHAQLNGAQIKVEAHLAPNYQLFLEEDGDKPDRAISDNEEVVIAGHVRHFFAVPPATFGAAK